MGRLATILCGVSVLLSACHGGSIEVPVDAGASSSSTASVAEAIRIARGQPQWTAALRPGAATALRDRGAAFENAGFGEARDGAPMAFGARSSKFGDGALEVRAGDAQVSLKVEDARGVPGSIVDGDVIYPEVHPATDFLVGTAPGRVETFWLLHDERAPSTFVLSLALTGLVPREVGGAIEGGALPGRGPSSIVFGDERGAVRIRIPRPYAVDANGTRRAASMRLDGDRVVITLDRRELAYPILLDPALEQVTWTDVGYQVPAVAGQTMNPAPPNGLARASGSARSGNGLVYLFGGAGVAGNESILVRFAQSGLFQWNGTDWTESENGGFPDELTIGDPEAATTTRTSDIVWDPVRQKLMMFGSSVSGSAEKRMGAYEYDPIGTKTWTKVCLDSSACYTSAPPVTCGSPEITPSAVYAFGKVLVVHSAGTFAWNPTTKVFDKFAATPDLQKSGASLAFDASRNRLVAYGDNAGGIDTWETDGSTWAKVSTTGPVGVQNAALAYHPARKRVMLWANSGLWSWNGTTATWTAVALDGAGPPARPNGAFTYAENVGKLLLFGGGDLGVGSSCFDMTWANPYDGVRRFRRCTMVDTWTSTLFGGACAVTADCVSGNTCVDGVCCKTACTGVCQACDVAGSVGTCSSVKSAEDPGTCSGVSACDANGACKKKQAQGCSIGGECLTGNCTDGFCCDTACIGSCESCNLAGKAGTCSPLAAGAPGKTCGFYTCSGLSASCRATCSADSECAPNAFCNEAAACVAQLLTGGTCARNRQCGGGACVDAVCCDSPCGGACDVCSAALGATANGTCTVLAKTASPAECGPSRCSGTSAACGTTCAVDADCSSGGFCSGTVCVLARKKGESCERAAQCASGLACADGVCCNEACDGACRACSALNKQSGDASGECGPAKEGTNPSAKCAKSDVSTCGATGFCNASGSCATYGAGTPCGPTGTTTCEGESVKGQTCDGLGACIVDNAGIACTPGRCLDGACKTTCATDADCATDAYCTAGSCKKKAAAGAQCAIDLQCASGFCADGVCCSARCDRSCEACDQTGTAGTCIAVTGKPRLGHPACAAGEPGNPCGAAACDGAERASCAKKAGADVACRASSCEADVETLPASCDGSGACPAAETRPCQPFACGATACNKSCTTEKDCKAGFVCNTATGACTAGDKCVGSVVTRVDGTTTDCSPYVCESSGRCKTTCATSADCVASTVCNGAVCVEASAPSAVEEESGGCATTRRGGSSAATILLVLAVASALRRRSSPRCDVAPR